MQPPLPDMPAPPPATVRAPAAGRMAKYRGKRRLCDECTRLIHEYGAHRAPYPMHATWKHHDDGGDLYLCYAHRETQR